MGAITYDSYSAARAHFKDLLDAAEHGLPTVVRREDTRAAVVNADRLRHFLAHVMPTRAEAVAESGGWSIFIPGTPISADGGSFDEALDEMVGALREYADDWQDHLLASPNHRDNWGLVQLISLSDDGQLKAWLAGTQA